MTPADLRALIHSLHGERGESAFARGVGISDRTVRRLLAGESAMRPSTKRAVLDYARQQAEDRCPVCGHPRHKTGTPPA